MRYLDPKADLTFKRVFGEHEDLVISLINALLPLEGDGLVETVEYLMPEMVPDSPTGKDSIVDVRCRDGQGRQFIVEMQMIWTRAFEQRVVFNASKAYVRQTRRGGQFELLQPVYSLNLVNDIFLPEYPECIHHYSMVHEQHTDKVIEGLHLTFVELPKFTPETYLEKRMAVLWLRYLTEIGEETRTAPAELLAVPETRKALEEVEWAGYTDGQMLAYDHYWDMVSVEKTLASAGVREAQEKGMKLGLAQGRAQGVAQGRAEGRAEGLEQGRAEGLEQGRLEGVLATARKMKGMGMDLETITKLTGLDGSQVQAL